MILLYILLAILGLLLLLFHVAVRITLEYNDKFSAKIGVLFFNYDVTKPRKKKAKKEKKPKKEKNKKPKKEKKKAKSPEEEPKKKPKKSISDIFGFISFILRIVSASSKRLMTLIPIKLYYFEACCASSEAEETAMLYARLSNAAYAMFEALKRFTRFTYNPEKVFIYPDYTKGKAEYKVKILIKIRLMYLLRTGFAALGVVLKEFSTPKKKARPVAPRPASPNSNNGKASSDTSHKEKSTSQNTKDKNIKKIQEQGKENKK